MALRFFDFEGDLLHIEPKFLSSKWTIYYNDVGTFEAHFPVTSTVFNIVMDNRYVVVKEGDNTAILIGKDTQTDLTIYGRTCNWILTKRITPKFAQITNNVESMSRGFVTTAFADVTNFVLGTPLNLTETVDFTKDTAATTADAVKECLNLQSCGHNVVFDTTAKQWVYNVLKGSELQLIISEANKNAYGTQITEDMLDYASGGYFDKQQEASEGSASTDTVFTYITADSSKTGIYKWDAILSGGTETEAASDLAAKKINSAVTVSAKNIKCGVDYNLGDIVRVQVIKGTYRTTVQKRISGVEIWCEQGSTGEKAIFEEV